MPIIGRWRDTNGDTVFLQRRKTNSLAMILWLIIWVIKFPFGLIGFGFYKRKSWTYYHEDLLDESNDKYKAIAEMNLLAERMSALRAFITSEDKRIADIKKRIRESSTATRGYSDEGKFDLSKFKYVTTSIMPEEARFVEILRKVIKTPVTMPQSSGRDDDSFDETFVPERFKRFSYDLAEVAKDNNVKDLTFHENPKNKGQGNNKNSGGGGGTPNKQALQAKKKLKSMGETDASYQARIEIIDRGDEVPEDWDLKQ